MEHTLRAATLPFRSPKKRRLLTTRGIVFLVVAAAAPLTAMVGNLPIAFARGNGAGVPGAFLLATLTLICFALGYAAISQRVVGTGAFYTFVAQGLGKPAGVGAALIAVLAYTALTVGLAAAFGYFVGLVAGGLGITVPWWVFAAGGAVATGVLGYRSIELSSKVLGVLMVAETAILAVFDAAVLMAKGSAALPATSFAPGIVFGPGFAIALMFAYTAFTGFESAALFGEEAEEPAKSIPRATLIAVALIGAFYLGTAWLVVGAVDPAASGGIAGLATDQGGQLMFTLIGRYCGEAVAQLAAVLLCTSLLASYLAIHNAASRYLFALGREKVLPQALGQFHPARYAPSNASVTVSLVTAASLALFLLGGQDPYASIMPSLIGLATLGIILLQALAAVAIVVYFRRFPAPGVLRTLVAPAVGAIGLIAAVLLIAANYALLTGVDHGPINALPFAYPAIGAVGVVFALWLRSRRPAIYEGIGVVELRSQHGRRAEPVARYGDRYCIVGAGPCGLLAARAFRLEGIPYDQFERHSGVGGIWDIDNPGTPMYESAHFISSKFTSGFFGLPMPASYPDYPDNVQILDYIRTFADRFGLREGVTFDTGVAQAVPLGDDARDGWRVTLTTGEVRHYRGIVCATGVTWHPSLPDYPGLADFAGEVRHTVTHRSAAELKGRRVLIVGCGNSGADIACDAARNADQAFLSVRRGYRFVPKHIFGIPTDVFIGARLSPPDGVVVPDDTSRMLDAIVGDLTRLGLPAPDHEALQSHPIMNTQVVHHLAHGDLTAKRDVDHFTATGAVFADGSQERFDLVLFATGYHYKLPYLDEALFTWNAGHPELYLNIFHRRLRGLSVVGFAEFADAGFQRFDEMAQMVAMDAYLAQSGKDQAAWAAMKAEHRPNLRGAMHYIDSPRHTNYVDVTTYRRVLAEIRTRFGWFDPTEATYESLRRKEAA